MPDIAAISAVLSSIKSASDIARLVRESGTTLEQAEYKLKLAELVEKLADAKLEIVAIQDVIDERDKKIKALEQAALVRGKILFKAPSYWLNDGTTEDGPFCQQCYDSTDKLIRLTGTTGEHRGRWACRTCKSIYLDVTYGARSFIAEGPNRFG